MDNCICRSVLLVLYGIGRGGRVSHRSILSNVIDPIKSLGLRLTVVYVLKHTGNACDAPRDLYPLLEVADIFYIANESELLDSGLLDFSKRFRDKHLDDFISNSNLICQLRKIQISTELVDYNNFDRIVHCRDDLLFYPDNLDWGSIISVSQYLPVTSAYFWNNGMGERLFVGRPSEMLVIANRISWCRQSIQNSGCLNGEYLMKFVTSVNSIRVGASFLKFSRIRTDMVVHSERFFLSFWRISESLSVILAIMRFQFYKLLARRE